MWTGLYFVASHLGVEYPAGGEWLSLSEVPKGGAESGSLKGIECRGYLGVADVVLSRACFKGFPLKKTPHAVMMSFRS